MNSGNSVVQPATMLLRLGRGSEVLRQEWFVDSTYLQGDDGPLLFVHQFVEYRTPRGNVHKRGDGAIWSFPNEEAMTAMIERLGASEGHGGDVPCRGWVPEGWEGAKTW